MDTFDDPTHRRFFTLRTMNYFTGVSQVHYSSAVFVKSRAYLRLTLGWPRHRLIRFPLNFFPGPLGLVASLFGVQLVKLPFVTGTLYFAHEKGTNLNREGNEEKDV